MSFNTLNLAPEILRVISECGYNNPTPIQEKSIPKVLDGKDLCACAQTGTGKTAAFLLPSLTKLTKPPLNSSKGPRVLILVPTRELALQVSKEARKYSKYFKMINVATVYGGVPYPKQRKELSRHVEILVATPGRLMDHMERGRINFSRLEILILDEADRMLDMGFVEDVRMIASKTPQTRQTLLFSATLKSSVAKLVNDLLKSPEQVTIIPDPKNIEQLAYKVDGLDHKHKILNNLLKTLPITQSIIFTSTKSYADELTDKLNFDGHNSLALHGDISQARREKTINHFRNGKVKYLIATDVAARGIDIKDISHIFNFDLPNNPEDYIHRIGRTGRIGSTGFAISFVSKKDSSIFQDIEKYLKKSIKIESIPGLEAKFQNSSTNKNFSNAKKFSNNRRFSSNKRFSDSKEGFFSKNKNKGSFRSKH